MTVEELDKACKSPLEARHKVVMQGRNAVESHSTACKQTPVQLFDMFVVKAQVQDQSDALKDALGSKVPYNPYPILDKLQ